MSYGHMHCKISVDFTVNNWQSAASPFPFILLQAPVKISEIGHRLYFFVIKLYNPTKVFSSTVG